MTREDSNSRLMTHDLTQDLRPMTCDSTWDLAPGKSNDSRLDSRLRTCDSGLDSRLDSHDSCTALVVGSGFVKDVEDKVSVEEEKVLDIWKAYYRKLSNEEFVWD